MPATDVDSISASQQSFDLRAQHFGKIVGYAQTMVGYRPNEPELSITGLLTHRDLLLTWNKEVGALASNLFAARYTRNQLLYAPKTGVYDLMIAVRKNVNSGLGPDDARY